MNFRLGAKVETNEAYHKAYPLAIRKTGIVIGYSKNKNNMARVKWNELNSIQTIQEIYLDKEAKK